MRLVSLILSAVCLLGCAVQPAPVSDSSESNTKVSAYAASQAEQNEEERTVAESLLPQTGDGGDTSGSSVAPERAGAENTDNAAEKQPAPAETAPPAAPKEPATPAPVPEDKPSLAPTPAPTQKPAEKQEEEPAPAPTPEPAPAPKPAASGNIYSIAEAIQAGNEYARAQYGVTIDTTSDEATSTASPFDGSFFFVSAKLPDLIPTIMTSAPMISPKPNPLKKYFFFILPFLLSYKTISFTASDSQYF